MMLTQIRTKRTALLSHHNRTQAELPESNFSLSNKLKSPLPALRLVRRSFSEDGSRFLRSLGEEVWRSMGPLYFIIRYSLFKIRYSPYALSFPDCLSSEALAKHRPSGRGCKIMKIRPNPKTRAWHRPTVCISCSLTEEASKISYTGRKFSVFPVLYRLYNYCYTIKGERYNFKRDSSRSNRQDE